MPGSTHEHDWADTDTGSASDQTTNLPPGGLRKHKRVRRTGTTNSSGLPAENPDPVDDEHPKEAAIEKWWKPAAFAVLFVLNYVVEVLYFALIILRRPLSLFLVAYLVARVGLHAYSTLGATLVMLFDPLCQVPIVSHLVPCDPRREHTNSQLEGPVITSVDYPQLTGLQVATFDELLEGSVSGARLGLEMKKAEIATSDLTTLVRISQLAVRVALADSLNNFSSGAKRAGRGLQVFGAKVRGATDRIIAMNDYTLRTIEHHAAAQRAIATQPNPSWFHPLFSAFRPLTLVNPSLLQPAPLITLFNQAMAALESELHTLILAAEGLLHEIDDLEELLKAVHAIAAMEELNITAEQDALLAQLWTMLGGNREELRQYGSRLKLLTQVSECRKHALAHVSGTLQTLHRMSADLEVLRARVTEPILFGDETIPLEIHIQSIKGGVERLIADRAKNKLIENAIYAVAAGD